MSEKQQIYVLNPVAEEPQWRRKVRVALGGLSCILLAFILVFRVPEMISGHNGRRTPTAHELLKSTPLIDTHNDFPSFIRAAYGNDIYQDNFTSDGEMPLHVDFPRLREGGLGAQFWSAFVECPKDSEDFEDKVYAKAIHDTLQQIDLVHRLVDEFPYNLVPATTADEIRWNFDTNRKRISSLIGIEGLHQIGNSASILRLYCSLGVRYATLTHQCHNKYADSEKPEPYHNGLSRAGVDMVHEMNRIGMMVDLSHTSADTQRDALHSSYAPVIFSHSNAYSLCNNTRNVPDDVLHLVKKNDGVVMVTFLPAYVTNDPKDATLDYVADHIQYIGELIGYRHVGIGSDYDGMLDAPKGLEDVSKYPDLITELLNRGVDAEDVKNIMGLNTIRVLEKVERVAAHVSQTWKPLQDKIVPSW